MSTEATISQPSAQQIQAAIDWLLSCEEQNIDFLACEPLQQWLKEDERHQLAWQRICAIHAVANDAHTPAILQEAKHLTQHANPFAVGKVFYDQYKGKLAAVLCCVVLLGLVKQSLWADWALADYRSQSGEIKTIALSDGSVVKLASQSAIDVSYQDNERRIVLKKGQMWVAVAKDIHRPLLVQSKQGTATALGTVFSVQLDSSKQTSVTVAESKVAVCLDQSANCQVLQANQSIQFTKHGLSKLNSVDAQASLAWQDKKLLANNLPLSDVLKALQPYHRGVLWFDENKLQGKMVSGVFPLDNADEALRALQVLYPLQINHYTPYLTRVSI